MKMEWFELASRSVVVLDQVNSFREESALQWGPVVGTTLRVVSSEAMASLEQQTPNAEEQSAVLPDEDRDPVYEEVYDLEKVFRHYPKFTIEHSLSDTIRQIIDNQHNRKTS